MPVTGPLQSFGTRIACIPVHRLGKDGRMLSPKKAAAIAECSQANVVACSCQSYDLPEMCVTRSAAASNCQSANALCEVHHAQVEERVPLKVGESKEVDVRMMTPEKCCNITKIKKIVSPIATDKCTVSLARIAIPENSAVKVSEISACKDTSASAHPVVFDDVHSACTTDLSVHATVTRNDTTSVRENQDDSRLPSLWPSSIMYPSCEQNVFLGSFGLASKAELPQLHNAAGNRLHRDVGGKLRRSVRPNMWTQMMYQRTNSMRCMSFEGDADVSSTELSSRSLHTSRESSPRSSHECNLSSDVSMKKLSSVFLKRLRPSVIDKTANVGSCAEIETSESTARESGKQQSSLSILADMAVADLEAVMMQDTEQLTPAQNTAKPSTAKPKVRSDFVP